MAKKGSMHVDTAVHVDTALNILSSLHSSPRLFNHCPSLVLEFQGQRKIKERGEEKKI